MSFFSRSSQPRDKSDISTALLAIFFLFGFGIMAWIPRFPEIKENLQLSNGEFGSLISTGALGGIISLFTIGHVVNHLGTRKILLVGTFTVFPSLAIIVHLQSPLAFLIANLAIGFTIAAFHISITAQSIHEQERISKLLLPKTAGMWTAGAVTTIILSGFLTTRVSLAWHITILEILTMVAMLILIRRISPFTVGPATDREGFKETLKGIKDFEINWPLSVGMIMAIQMEFSLADWGAIFAKEDLGVPLGLIAIPYLSFLLAMILGRLTFHHFTDRYSIKSMMQLGGIVGGGGFVIAVLLSYYLQEKSSLAALVIASIGFAMGGLGSSFMAPIFTNAAKNQSRRPFSVVIGQLGVMNNAMAFIVKALIAWVAQWFSLPIALVIPGIMLMCVGFFIPKTNSHTRIIH